jgi:two-component system response regulator AtoC
VRLGTTKPRQVDVRVLAATHRDLEERVAGGLFRQDLFYRLAVVPIHVPPLRERREDIPGLCELFRDQISSELKLARRPLAGAALERLQRYDFPGNIRELRNLMERALILATGNEIGVDDFLLPAARSAGDGGGAPGNTGGSWMDSLPEAIDLRSLLDEMERDLILRALKSSGGVQAEAARRLQLSRSDLAYKLSKHRLKP